MKIIKPFAALAAVVALAALASSAHATGWTYSWDGTYTGQISANTADPGNGGLFNSTLKYNGTQVGLTGSYCNELGQNIVTGAVTPIAVLALTGRTQTQWAAAAGLDSTLGTYGGPGQGFYSVANANTAAIAYVVATHFNDTAGSHGSTGNWDGTIGGGGAQDVGRQALQLAIWHLWGFTGINAYNNTNAGTAGNLAQQWVSDANSYLTAHGGYVNNDVVWVRMKVEGDQSFQDQIMYIPGGNTHVEGIVPEASSLALLLPGLIPIGVALRRRTRNT